MRRTMPALFVLFCFASQLPAQQPSSGLRIAQAAEQAQSLITTETGNVAIEGKPVSVVPGGMTAQANYMGSEIATPNCDRPYSQLAIRMGCDNVSPNLWSCYPSERAALVAHVMRHVDHQCGCTHGGCSSLHKTPCTSGCSSGCDVGCSDKGNCREPKINRYKQPFSSLYAIPSTDCASGKCKLRKGSSGCTECGSVGSCNANAVGLSGCASGNCASASSPAPVSAGLPQRPVIATNPVYLPR